MVDNDSLDDGKKLFAHFCHRFSSLATAPLLHHPHPSVSATLPPALHHCLHHSFLHPGTGQGAAPSGSKARRHKERQRENCWIIPFVDLSAGAITHISHYQTWRVLPVWLVLPLGPGVGGFDCDSWTLTTYKLTKLSISWPHENKKWSWPCQ